MKHINEEYIPRQRRTSISKLDPYSCHPETKEELKEIIINRILNVGNECDLNDIDVSLITDMSYLFNANKDFNNGNPIFMDFNGDISRWDVSNVTNMEYMFNHCYVFNCNLSLWDVSSVTNMEGMFTLCRKFNSDISRWDVSNVENMVCMFFELENFEYDLSNWNISKVQSGSSSVRRYMKHINEEYIPRLRRTSISKIDKYTCYPETKYELRKIISERIEQEGPTCSLNDIDVSLITDMSGLFDKEYFKYNKVFNCDITLWDVSNVTVMRWMFLNCQNFNQDLSNWDVSKVVNMLGMFNGCLSLKKLPSWYVNRTCINEEYIPRLRRTSISRIQRDDIPYVHFLTTLHNEPQALTIYDYDCIVPKGLEYSQDKIQWFELTENILDNPIEFKDGNLWIRGTSKIGTADYKADTSESLSLKFTTNAEIIVSGNICTLIDYANYQSCDTSSACFRWLFYYCFQLIDASKLKLDILHLPKYCYSGMFYRCENLVNAPELPAISLSDGCYSFMFKGCTSLRYKACIPRGIDIDEFYEFSDEIYVDCPCENDNDNYIDDENSLNEEYIHRLRRTSITKLGPYTYFPETKEELQLIIIERIEKEGNKCNLNNIDVSLITDMSLLFDRDSFKYARDFNCDISLWDVSNVTNMVFMFNGCENFDLDLSRWDVSNVIDMAFMFCECKKFDGDISLWDVSNVRDMMYMFYGCKKFNSDLSRWNVSNVTNIGHMFDGCDSFNLDLSNWDISKAENTNTIIQYMNINEEYIPRLRRTTITKLDSYLYHPETKEELQLIIIECIEKEGPTCSLNDIDVSLITDMSYLFNANANFNKGNKIFLDFNGDISLWNVSNVTDMSYMFNTCHRFNGDISNWDVSIVTNMEGMFNVCNDFNRDISLWNVSNVTNMRNMFNWCDNFNFDISRWDVSNVTDMYGMFRGCYSFKYDLSSWNISNARNTNTVRRHMKSINEEYVPRKRRTSISKLDPYSYHPETREELQLIIIERIENEGPTCRLNDIDVSGITDMSHLFNVFDNEIFKDFNGDISEWDVSNVTNMKSMFCKCESFNSDISKWDVSSVTDMQFMFYFCKKFNSDISLWDVSNVTNMGGMFYECKSFNRDISLWDVSKVTSMYCMFYNCEIFDLDLSMWNVSNVTNMHLMFRDCERFNCNLSNWNVSKVRNNEYMFVDCPLRYHPEKQPDFNKRYINEEYIPIRRNRNISKIPTFITKKTELRNLIIERIEKEGPNCNLNDIDVSMITDMSNLFDAGYRKIFKDFNGDISLWDVSNVTNMNKMFNLCESFNQDLSNWDVSNVTNMGGMFYGCKNFEYDLSNWDISKAYYTDSIRKHMRHINEEYIPRLRRNSISRIQRDNTPYVHFSCNGTLTLNFINNIQSNIFDLKDDTFNIEYSLDLIEWISADVASDITLDSNYYIDVDPEKENTKILFNDNLWLRGKNPKGTFIDDKISLGLSLMFKDWNEDFPKITVSGDIRTLIDWENYQTCDTSKAKFAYLFAGNCSLVSAKDLILIQDKTAIERCYEAMFRNCPLLKDTPLLPALTLCKKCYCVMFSGCENLEDAPDLPATKLSIDCYNGMFANCGLKHKARLPRVKIPLNFGTASNMYKNCPCEDEREIRYIDEPEKELNEEYIPRLRRTSISKIEPYSCHPLTKKELKLIVIKRIKKEGLTCSLNDIDVSSITDMSYLFNYTEKYKIFKDFNGNISKWNVSNVTNMEGLFYGCNKFNSNLSTWNVSNVTNMRWMFTGCYEFDGDISLWDVSKVTNMSYMFYYCHDFNSDISLWDVSNVTNMACMFYNCRNFDCDLSRWDVSRVTNMDHMFCFCKNFNSDISQWDVSKVKDMNSMLYRCNSFKYDLSNWNISNAKYTDSVREHMKYINEEYIPRLRRTSMSRIEKEPPYIHFICSESQKMSIGFTDKNDYKRIQYNFKDKNIIELLENIEYTYDKIEWNKLSNVYLKKNKTTEEKTGKQFRDIWIRGKNPKGTNGILFFYFFDYTSVDVEGDIRTLVDWENYLTCDTSKAIFNELFSKCSLLRDASKLNLYLPEMADGCFLEMFYGCNNLEYAPNLLFEWKDKDNNLIKDNDVVYFYFYRMFEDCLSLKNIPLRVSKDNERFIYNGAQFTIEENLWKKDFLNEEYVPRLRKTSISKLDHYSCHPNTKKELRKIVIEHIENKGLTCSLNDIDVSDITDMSYLFDRDYFKYASDFNCDISMWNVSNVTDMQCMFWGCEKFDLDLSRWDVSSVTNMSYMFYKCYEFNQDLSLWNVSRVTKMIKMFYNCKKFNSDLSKWNISRVTDMESMFNECDSFNYDLSNWNITNARHTLSVRQYMKNINEEYIPRLKRTSISKLDHYSYYPKTKEELKEIIIERINKEGSTCNLNDIDVSGITNMSYLFNANKYFFDENRVLGNVIFENFNCDISKWDVSNVTDMERMFCNCYHFNQDISNWNVSKVTNMKLMFYNCKYFNSDISLWDVSNVTNMDSMFNGCKSFEYNLSSWNISKAQYTYTVRQHMKHINEEYIPRKRKTSISRIQQASPYIHLLTINHNDPQALTLYDDECIVPKGLEYSQDMIKWFELTREILLHDFIEFKDGHLWLRGKNENGTFNIETLSDSLSLSFSFVENTTKILVSGDIRTLIDWENYEKCKTDKASFAWLFYKCTPIVDASLLLLNIMNLSEICYRGMFYECENLVNAPDLPAVKLSLNCYNYMFKKCRSLEKKARIPEGVFPKGVEAYPEYAREMYEGTPFEDLYEDDYIEEKVKLNEEYVPRLRKSSISKLDPYTCHPETKEELREIIIERIEKEGDTCSLNDIDVSGITDMSYLFNANEGFHSYEDFNKGLQIFSNFNGDISLWNVSSVIDMEYMFNYCFNFNGNISKWDVSNVINMQGMFCGCRSFNSNISKWDVSSVTNMNSMFFCCNRFKSDISLWDVSNVTNMKEMFYECNDFNSNISSWNVSSVKNMYIMFKNCKSFNLDLSNWNITNANYTDSVTRYMRHINEEYVPRLRSSSISKLDSYSCHPKTKEELREIILERINEESPTCSLNDIDVSSITDMSYLFNANEGFHKGLKIFRKFNGDISKWDVSNVTNMKYMFNWCENFEGDISNWDVSSVRDMSYMFYCCRSFDLDLSSWDVSSVTDMGGMFWSCKVFNSNISSWNVSSVTDMSDMFWGCHSFDLDLSNWDISNAKFTASVRKYMKHFKQINEEYVPRLRRTSISKLDSCLYYPLTKEELLLIIIEHINEIGITCNLNNIDVSNITDMSHLFDVNYNNIFEKFNGDISMWDVSNVTDMSYMFNWCRNFNLNLSNWNVSNVTNMDHMFNYCKEFNHDLSNWDVSNVTDMKYMFGDCEKFDLDLSKWNVSNVTDMTYMFNYCKNFNSNISLWKVSKVTDMHGMFNNCKIFDLDLSRWNVSNVTDTSYMFYGCENFNSDISLWNVSNVTSMLFMFDGCKIFNLDLSNWNISNADFTESAEQYMKQINEEYVPRQRKSSISMIKPIETPYIHFSCNGKQILRIVKINLSNSRFYFIYKGDIEYSLDMEEWNSFNNLNLLWNGVTFYDNIWLRGKNSYGTREKNTSNIEDMNIMFMLNVDVKVSGDIRTLVDWEHYDTCDTHLARFIKLFRNCNQLVDASKLQLSITKLCRSCYEEMFYECKKLEKAPDLPADELSESCYEKMFWGCTKLNEKARIPKDKEVFSVFGSCMYAYCPCQDKPDNYIEDEEVSLLNEEYIPRKRKTSISLLDPYSCHPETKEELKLIIIERIKNVGDKCKLNDIDVSLITDMSYLFNASENLHEGDPIFKTFNGDISLWDVSNVTNMTHMFYRCTGFNSDISLWNVSNVTNMSCMFDECHIFNSDLSNWDVSNVTNMTCMFWGCESFNCDLSRWNVSKVTDMYGMFVDCKSFEYDLSSWDISKAEYADTVRQHMIHINEEYVPRLRRNSISRIDQDNSYIHFLSDGPQALTSHNGKVPQGLEYSQDMIEWFELTDKVLENSIEFKDNNLWLRGKSATGTIRKTEINYYTTYSDALVLKFTTKAEITISGDIRTLIDWENYQNCDTSEACFWRLFYNCELIVDASLLKLSIMDLCSMCYQNMFFGCSKLKYAPELPATKLSYGCYSGMFFDCWSLLKAPDLPAIELESGCYNKLFYNCSKLTSKAKIPEGVNITDSEGYQMYFNCKNINNLNEEYIPRQRKTSISKLDQYSCHPLSINELEKIIIERIENEGPTCDLNDIDVSLITVMSYLFVAEDNVIFKDFNGDISMWDVSNVTNMSHMFEGCKDFNCDISLWDVSKVTYMDNMFKGCKSFNSDISLWDVSNVINMGGIFWGCKNFNSDLSLWNVSNVTNMIAMFLFCKIFNSDLSLWDVSNVTNMERMFSCCDNFNSDLSLWNVSKVTNMECMFFACKIFNQDLSNWDVSKVTDMDSIFFGCDSFNLDLSNWDVSNMTNMNSMFQDCKHFNSDLSRWDVSNVTDMRGMFWNCEEFDLDLSGWDVSKVTDMGGMFYGCKIFDLDLSGWDVSKVTDMFAMFNDCKRFKADLSRWDVSKVKIMQFMFYGCDSFNSDISLWDVSRVDNMEMMFYGCTTFNSDLFQWDVRKVKINGKMFEGCPLNKLRKKLPRKWQNLRYDQTRYGIR